MPHDKLPNETHETVWEDGPTGGTRPGLPFPTDKPPKEYVVPDRPLADTLRETHGLPDENQNEKWVSPADRRSRG